MINYQSCTLTTLVSQRSSSTTTTKTHQNLTTAVTSSSSPPSTSVTESTASSKQSNCNQDLGMTSKYPQIQTPDIAATLAAVASRSTSPPVSSKNNLSGLNGYSESQSTRSSQLFSRYLQNPSPRNSITKESHLTIDKSSKNKEKSKSTSNERRNNKHSDLTHNDWKFTNNSPVTEKKTVNHPSKHGNSDGKENSSCLNNVDENEI